MVEQGELAALIERYAPHDGDHGVCDKASLHRASQPTEPKHGVFGAAVCVVAQGRKQVLSGGSVPEMTMQQCTDETTDKDMSTSFSPMAKEMCSKQDILKTATGYVTDSVCGIAGMTIKSHAEITGDFNSAYTVKSTSHSEGGAGGARDSAATIEAKWLGACKADQRAGDIVMPGGMKMNIKDMEKLKGLIPKQLPR